MSPLVRRGLIAAVAVVALVAVGAAVAARGSGDDVAGRVHQPGELKPAGPATPVEPARHLGPQGRVGQFVVKCTFSHAGPNDPIVHKGMTGGSHLHDFYGATTTDADSTPDSLVDGDTTCDKKVDTAAYWQPALYDHEQVVEPVELNAYYRAAPGVDPLDVEPMPYGLAMLAGDQYSTTPQPGEATGWTCGVSTAISDDVPTCPSGAPLHLVLTFPDCWDGQWLDSEDHISHVAYSRHGDCPATHPVHIPQLTASIKFPIWGEGHDLHLASGNIYSAHGDFLNAWDPAGLAREVNHCIHRGVVCDLASNREEESLFQAQ